MSKNETGAGGVIGDGFAVRAVEVLGADLAYMGTRFVATRESLAAREFQQMLVDYSASDIVYTDRISGMHANFLLPSLERMGIDVARWIASAEPKGAEVNIRAWKDAWSAGHGIATIHDIPGVAEMVERLYDEYWRACDIPPSRHVHGTSPRALRNALETGR